MLWRIAELLNHNCPPIAQQTPQVLTATINMPLHTSYTDRYSVEEAYDGDWDDMMSPDAYEEYIDRKRFAKSNGYAYPAYRTLHNY